MKKILSNNKFSIIAEDSEYIDIKEIKNCIKSLEILGIENIKIKGMINIDYEKHNKQIPEKDADKLYSCYIHNDYLDLEILSNNKVLFGTYTKYEVKVNKDKSYDYEGKRYNYYLSPIKRIELTW